MIEQIKKDQIRARKNRDSVMTKVLTYVLGQYETGSKKGQVGDEHVIRIIKKLINDNLETLKSTDRADDLIIQENKILEQYLPIQLSEKDIDDIIKNNDFKNIGEFMKFMKTEYEGQYDGKVASVCFKKVV